MLGDELIAHLLALHGIHPESVETRLARVIDELRAARERPGRHGRAGSARRDGGGRAGRAGRACAAVGGHRAHGPPRGDDRRTGAGQRDGSCPPVSTSATAFVPLEALMRTATSTRLPMTDALGRVIRTGTQPRTGGRALRPVRGGAARAAPAPARHRPPRDQLRLPGVLAALQPGGRQRRALPTRAPSTHPPAGGVHGGAGRAGRTGLLRPPLRRAPWTRTTPALPGPPRWEVDPAAWRDVVARCPPLADMTPEVEALLVNTTRDRREHWLAPIDDCFALVALVRREWQGTLRRRPGLAGDRPVLRRPDRAAALMPRSIPKGWSVVARLPVCDWMRPGRSVSVLV